MAFSRPSAMAYRGVMSAQPSEHEFPVYQVIELGGVDAAVVPMDHLRRLEAIERLAPAEVIAQAEEEAQIEADIRAHEAYVAAGRPGAERHEDVKRELLAEFGL